ncbi:MAG: hypothetical protein RLP44_06385 [Aggregatilineales bacterium]
MRNLRLPIITFTLGFLALLALDAYPGLRGGGGWRWDYDLSQNGAALLALALCLLVYLAGVIVVRRRGKVIFTLVWSFIGAVIIGVAVVGVRGDAGFLLFTRTVSPVQTGASRLAVSIMAEDGVTPTLENWLDVMNSARESNLIHFTTSPPGQPLIHFALADSLENFPASESISMALRPYQCSDLEVMRYTRGELLSVIFGMMMPLWAALAVLPLYFAANLLLDNRQISANLTAWWALIPTISLFAPTWNTLYPFLCVLAFALLLAGLKRGGGRGFYAYTFFAGVVMSATTFLNFAVLPVFLLFGTFTLGYAMLSHAPDEKPLARFMWAVRAGISFAPGLSVVWTLFYVGSGLTPIDIARTTFSQHSELVQRDYFTWLILHPYDTLLFVGWALTGVFLWALWRIIRSGWVALSPINLLAISLFATIILVNLAGIAQGENGRILSFYAPFVLLAGAGVMMGKSQNWDVPLLGAQALTVFVMATVLNTVPLDLNPRVTAPRTDMPIMDFLDPIPMNATFSSADFAGDFTLEAHRFVADLSNQAITLETIWRGGSQVERPYQFEIIARAENDIDGEIMTEPFRWYPQNGNYLTTCWQNGDVIHDVVVIPLPPVSAPVVWTLELSAVDARTGDVAGTATLAPINYP